MRRAGVVATVLAVMAAGAAGVVVAQMAAQPVPGLLPWRDADRVANGAALYAGHCAACHGAALEGQADWKERGADGLLPAPPHDETGHTWHHADPLLIDIVTRGTEAIVGGNYRSAMIGFGEILDDDEILDVLAFIKSTWPEEVAEIHDEINARAEVFGN